MTQNNEMARLEALLTQARNDTHGPDQVSGALMARVMADADLVLSERAQSAETDGSHRYPARDRSLWAGFMALIGGPRALGGLTAAALTGLWIGAASGSDVASYLGVGSLTETSASQSAEAIDLVQGEYMFAMVGGWGGEDVE
jgi:hypothetical protein